MSNDTIAGSGLEKMFYGQILSILVIIPLVGWIAAIVGIVLFLVGLHEAAGADEGYRTAFYVEIGILVLSVLAVFIGVLSIVTSILSLVVIYLVCTTTAGLLEVKGDLGTAARGRFAWKFYGGCTALVVVCSPESHPAGQHTGDGGNRPRVHRVCCGRDPPADIPLPGLQKSAVLNTEKRGAKAPRFAFRRASPARG